MYYTECITVGSARSAPSSRPQQSHGIHRYQQPPGFCHAVHVQAAWKLAIWTLAKCAQTQIWSSCGQTLALRCAQTWLLSNVPVLQAAHADMSTGPLQTWELSSCVCYLYSRATQKGSWYCADLLCLSAKVHWCASSHCCALTLLCIVLAVHCCRV